jgi:hypothetical protein
MEGTTRKIYSFSNCPAWMFRKVLEILNCLAVREGSETKPSLTERNESK